MIGGIDAGISVRYPSAADDLFLYIDLIFTLNYASCDFKRFQAAPRFGNLTS